MPNLIRLAAMLELDRTCAASGPTLINCSARRQGKSQLNILNNAAIEVLRLRT